MLEIFTLKIDTLIVLSISLLVPVYFEVFEPTRERGHINDCEDVAIEEIYYYTCPYLGKTAQLLLLIATSLGLAGMQHNEYKLLFFWLATMTVIILYYILFVTLAAISYTIKYSIKCGFDEMITLAYWALPFYGISIWSVQIVYEYCKKQRSETHVDSQSLSRVSVADSPPSYESLFPRRNGNV